GGEEGWGGGGKGEVGGHGGGREINLPLTVEGIEQSGSKSLDIGRQIVEEVAAVAGDAGWRHVQIACEIEGHRAVQDAAHGLDMVLRVGDADPLYDVMNSVGIGEHMVGGLPVR